MSHQKLFFAALFSGLPAAALALDNLNVENIEKLEVSTSTSNLVGTAITASQGSISDQEFQFRPLLRNGELLELVPGMVATQHSGSGKANQLFLRGFNLDHGTDFATFYDGMPVNLRSHGHGQGYTDLNFIIAESVKQIDFKKGPYYADIGDFSGAGSAHFVSHNKLTTSQVSLTLGQDQYYRFMASDQVAINSSTSLMGVTELQTYAGPWSDIDEDVEKKNALVKLIQNTDSGIWSLSFMGYDNQWNGADQIPTRAVESGLIDRLGSINPSAGGNSSRYSLNLAWDSQLFSFNAYAINYDLQLFSDFTYFLDDPENGDGFEQVDSRNIYGFNLHKHFQHTNSRTTLGVNTQFDDIDEVGLLKSDKRARIGALRLDNVEQYSTSLFVDHRMDLMENIQLNLGGRYDYYRAKVNNKLPINVNQIDLSSNTGSRDDDLFSVKANLIYQLNEHLDLYLSGGQGFHSNDARGTVSFVDPLTGEASEPVDPLVRSHGSEIGVQWTFGDSFNASAALWQLSLDSELLFVGDAGNTEASLASRRSGLELTAFWRINNVFTLDAEYAQSNARFTQAEVGEDRVPGSVDRVLQLGASTSFDNGFTGAIRLRHIGARVLEETGQIRSEPSTTVNALLAYTWSNMQLKAEILNLFDSHDHDIDYFYASRLPNETSSGIEDIHFHPLAPRNFRVSVNYQF